MRFAVHPGLRRWLRASGSLTARLKQCWGDVRVQVLSQRRERPTLAERHALGLSAHTPVLVRQVLLRGPAGEVVQARSACALAASHGAWRAVRGLGSQPLAALLYARSDIRRGPLHSSHLPARSPARRALVRVAGPAGLASASAWRRASVFERRGQRLVVSEHFARDWSATTSTR